MNKYLKIILIIAIILVLAVIGWFWLLPGSSAPVADKIRDGLPFGSGEDVNIPPVDSGQYAVDSGKEEEGRSVPKFFQVSKDPVAGFVVLAESPQASTTVRYADRATGHIYDTNLATGVKSKITNKTLPKIYEAFFSDEGEFVLLRSLPNDGDVVDNLSIRLTPPRTATSSDGLYQTSSTSILDTMRSVVTNGERLYFVSLGENSIVSTNFSGSDRRVLYSSRFTDWRIEPYTNGAMVYTKASYATPGYAYTASGGRLNKAFGPLNGLVIKPNNNNSQTAYSFVESGKTKLLATVSAESATEIFPGTLAEKCVWGTDKNWVLYCGIPEDGVGSGEPDGWYKGTTSFSDKIWRFDTRVDISEVLIEPEKSFGINVDVYRPALSPDENYLLFVNKRDLSLWALKLGE